jgi:hypothetical protein
MTIGSADVIVRKDNHLETQIDDETILMHIETGQIFGLANTAKEIWAAVGEPISFDRLVERLVAEFAVDVDACRSDVAAFLAGLQRAGMIDIRAAA